MTEPQWVTLTIAVMSGGPIDRAQFVSQVAGALKLTEAEAQARTDELAAAQLLELSDGNRSRVSVTDAGSDLHARVRTSVAGITQRLWGDLPAEDLVVAGCVLATVLERANAELART